MVNTIAIYCDSKLEFVLKISRGPILEKQACLPLTSSNDFLVHFHPLPHVCIYLTINTKKLLKSGQVPPAAGKPHFENQGSTVGLVRVFVDGFSSFCPLNKRYEDFKLMLHYDFTPHKRADGISIPFPKTANVVAE